MSLFDHLVTQRREADHPAAALHQRHVEKSFQLADTCRKRRLRHEAGVRGPAEMTVFVQRDEILQLADGGQVSGHAWCLAFHLVVDMGHLQFALLDREGEFAFDQIEGIAAEHLAPPALQDRQITHACGQLFKLVGAGQQARGDVDFAGPDLQQQLEHFP